MDKTISDMDIEVEQKDNKTQFLEDEIGKPDSKVVGEMNRLDLYILSKKGDKVMNRLNKTLNNQKKLKTKNKKTKTFK